VQRKEKSTDLPFNFYIVTFGEKQTLARNKRPLKALRKGQFYSIVFINPDRYIQSVKGSATSGNSAFLGKDQLSYFKRS